MFTYIFNSQQNKKLENIIPGTLVNTLNESIVTGSKIDSNLVEQEINNFRKRNNKNELTQYEPLCKLAKIRVEEIKTDWSHNGFESRNEEIYTRFCNTNNIICTSAGENLAKGTFINAKEVVDEWEKSEGHKENMLDEYNVQCIAVSENHYVSLFAYTQDLEAIEKAKKEILETNVKYDYNKVVYWEEQQELNTNYLKSWESGKDNNHYEKKELDMLLKLLKEKLDISNELWDGYTNSKITNQQSQDLEIKYWEISNESAKLSKELNQMAYENCRADDIEESICKVYKN